MQYWLAHADLKRGFSVSLIVVYSEGMSKVNDICASEVAIETSLQLLLLSSLFCFLLILPNYIISITLETDGYALYAVMMGLQ